MINVYEGDPEELVFREMNDEEFAQWKRDAADAAAAPESDHPLLEQVKSMTPEERATLREMLT
jgi:hypothetical protein